MLVPGEAHSALAGLQCCAGFMGSAPRVFTALACIPRAKLAYGAFHHNDEDVQGFMGRWHTSYCSGCYFVGSDQFSSPI